MAEAANYAEVKGLAARSDNIHAWPTDVHIIDRLAFSDRRDLSFEDGASVDL